MSATATSHSRGTPRRWSFPTTSRHEIAVLKGVAGHLVMFTAERTDGLLAERELLAGLAERLLAGAPSTLDPAFREDWDDARDDAARRRVVVDQVASLTDPSAVALARRLD